MRMSGITRLLLILLSLKNASCYCLGESHYTATTYWKYLSSSLSVYSNNDDCTLFIAPEADIIRRARAAYLEISWSLFDVKGYMPDCEQDYVEVFLTK